MKNFYTTSLGLVFVTALFSCTQPNQKNTQDGEKKPQSIAQKSTLPYQLNAGLKIGLPDELLEISGITFLSGNDENIFAIQDEQGLLYQFNSNSHQTKFAQFGKDGDYEDIGANQTHFFILKSNGEIYSFPIAEKDNIQYVTIQKDLVPKGEYEGFYIDSKQNLAYILCKECKVDKKSNATSGYVFQIDDKGNLTSKETFNIDIDQLKSFSDDIKKTFKPSALAKNEQTKEWYILSSVDKALVRTDENFTVQSIDKLDGKIFSQPEGIAFDGKNNLYISNEAGDADKATIYKFDKK